MQLMQLSTGEVQTTSSMGKMPLEHSYRSLLNPVRRVIVEEASSADTIDLPPKAHGNNNGWTAGSHVAIPLAVYPRSSSRGEGEKGGMRIFVLSMLMLRDVVHGWESSTRCST